MINPMNLRKIEGLLTAIYSVLLCILVSMWWIYLTGGE
jgi:hypothetical protein